MRGIVILERDYKLIDFDIDWLSFINQKEIT